MADDFEKNMKIEVERSVVSKLPQWVGVYMHTTGEYDIFVKALKREPNGQETPRSSG